MKVLEKHLKPYLKESKAKEAYALEADLYCNESFYSLENDVVFQNNWQLVGHIDQLSNTGDQLVCEIAELPIVVVRNENNELKAFHNVCRHRAGPVATENGNSKVLRCKYHGWTYSLDGELNSAPEMGSTPNFDVCQYHLPQVEISEWQGFIFVSINKPAVPLEKMLSGITDNIKPINLSEMTFSHREEYIIECNWKVYMDNYLEGYHIPHIHPELNQLIDYRNYETEVKAWYSYQYSKLTEHNNEVDNFYGKGTAHYYCIFPNLMLNILPGRLQTNQIIPITKNKTKVVFDYFYTELESEETQKLIAQDKTFSHVVQKEDINICEQVQKGLNSGSYVPGRLCVKRELGVLHYQNLIRKSFRDAIKTKHIKVSKT
ncbi:MAG: aromatic ring-hydroxylating dioxygenase subunit alpha [Gammaproteobacteria bacterium]|nr:aromatic ring-hydroxylating dioxygenase subunit alpha [Gammaproteobacteria bacterium]MDH5628583.1 aromatic ring-hydroxylating dioxygenase subunit alpha [Gammaproteobacteria bacterium]